MARLQIHTKAPDISLDAVIPDHPDGKTKEMPVLWLLHDVKGNCSSWMRYSQIEYFAEEYQIAVLCISGENGFFLDTVDGVQWEANFLDKLWPMMQEMLPISDKKEKNYIAGAGMGGYGAIHMALHHPDMFAYAGSFGGRLDEPEKYWKGKTDYPASMSMDQVFGKREKKDMELCSLLEDPAADVKFYIACSSEDTNLNANEHFVQCAKNAGYETIYKKDQGQEDWGLLNIQMENFIKKVMAAKVEEENADMER